MARNESDREDLIKEATGLPERIELQIPGQPELVFAGFRRDGCLSVYFGQDSMLQFSPDDGLRRAFRDGALYRTQKTTLARLERSRTETTSELIRTDLDAQQLGRFLQQAQAEIAAFAACLREGTAVVVRAVPEHSGDQLLEKVQQRLAGLIHEPLRLADAFKGRR